MPRAHLICKCFIATVILGYSGCSKPSVPSQPQESGTRTADASTSTEADVDTEAATIPQDKSSSVQAKEILEKTLEAWVFGESCTKFQEANPEIRVSDERSSLKPFGKPCIESRLGNLDKATIDLLEYKIGPARQTPDGKFHTFMVLLTLQGGERETFTRNVEYRVMPFLNSDTKWFVQGVPVDRR